jgi:probable F420-dependent oxidoreductase
MREFILAMRAIWTTWNDGTKLDFSGEFYTHTLMTPFFDPGPLASGAPPVLIAAVGEGLTRVAGEVADGMLTHPTGSSPRTLRELTRPALARGAARTDRDPASLELMAGPLVVTGRSAAEVAAQREHVRELLTFLYSTPAYWPTLELFGWRDVGEHLHRLTREGRWADMKGAITDAMLDALVPQGRYEEIAGVLRDLYGGLASSVTFPLPDDPTADAQVAAAIAALREGR